MSNDSSEKFQIAASLGTGEMTVAGSSLEFQGGSVNKRTAAVTIVFPQPFRYTPVILLTSHWAGQGTQVGAVETIVRADPTGFSFVSINSATNYYVNWLAVANR